MNTMVLIVIGIITTGVITALAIGIMDYQTEFNQNCHEDFGKVTGFLQCIWIHEDFSEPRVTGKMAQEICSIVGGECPRSYIGNILEDGSKMVGIITSNADTKTTKQFEFIIKNGILSYDVTLYEN